MIRERAKDITARHKRVSELHPVIANKLHTNRERARETAGRRQLANFSKGDFIMLARDEFNKGEKLYLLWRGPR